MRKRGADVRLAALFSLLLATAISLLTLYLVTIDQWRAAMLLHAAAFCLGALSLRRWLIAAGCEQRGLYQITLLMSGCIPGFGALALPLAAVYGTRNPVIVAEDDTMTVEVPRLPFKPLATDQSLSFSRGGLFEVLERSSDTEKQVVAVMATTRMKSKQAVPLLKVAMRDESDDVRLLAYSIKDRKESEINSKIKRLLEVLDEDGRHPDRKPLSARETAATERSLAFLYWELVYLDLAEGDIRDFFLEQVVRRATSALREISYGPLTMLLARAHMERGAHGPADEALELAERSGVDSVVLAPYRAEVAFHERRFSEVRDRLLEAGTSPHEALREVLDYWLKPA